MALDVKFGSPGGQFQIAPPPNIQSRGYRGSGILAARQAALGRIAAANVAKSAKEDAAQRKIDAIEAAEELLKSEGAYEERMTSPFKHSAFKSIASGWDITPEMTETERRLMMASNFTDKFVKEGYDPDSAYTYATSMMEERSVRVYDTDRLMDARAMLLKGDVSSGEADSFLKAATRGGFAGEEDLHNDMQEESIQLLGSMVRPFKASEVNVYNDRSEKAAATAVGKVDSSPFTESFNPSKFGIVSKDTLFNNWNNVKWSAKADDTAPYGIDITMRGGLDAVPGTNEAVSKMATEYESNPDQLLLFLGGLQKRGVDASQSELRDAGMAEFHSRTGKTWSEFLKERGRGDSEGDPSLNTNVPLNSIFGPLDGY